MSNIVHFGLYTSIIFLIINVISSLIHKKRLCISIFGAIAGIINLVCIVIVVAISIVNLNIYVTISGFIYFMSVYYTNDEQDKKLKKASQYHDGFSRYKKNNLPKTTKDYIMEYLPLILSFLPFIAYLISN